MRVPIRADWPVSVCILPRSWELRRRVVTFTERVQMRPSPEQLVSCHRNAHLQKEACPTSSCEFSACYYITKHYKIDQNSDQNSAMKSYVALLHPRHSLGSLAMFLSIPSVLFVECQAVKRVIILSVISLALGF